MGLTDSIINASETVMTNQLLIRLVTAIIILLIGLIIGKIIGNLILKLLKEIDFDKTIKKTTGYKTSLAETISKFTSYFIYFLAIIMSLESLGLTPFVLNMISLAVIIIIGVSIILGIKDFIPNFIAGYSLKRKGLFKKGEQIKVGNVEGKIKKINLIDTHLETSKKDLMVIPNSYFNKNLVLKKKK